MTVESWGGMEAPQHQESILQQYVGAKPKVLERGLEVATLVEILETTSWTGADWSSKELYRPFLRILTRVSFFRFVHQWSLDSRQAMRG